MLFLIIKKHILFFLFIINIHSTKTHDLFSSTSTSQFFIDTAKLAFLIQQAESKNFWQIIPEPPENEERENNQNKELCIAGDFLSFSKDLPISSKDIIEQKIYPKLINFMPEELKNSFQTLDQNNKFLICAIFFAEFLSILNTGETNEISQSRLNSILAKPSTFKTIYSSIIDFIKMQINYIQTEYKNSNTTLTINATTNNFEDDNDNNNLKILNRIINKIEDNSVSEIFIIFNCFHQLKFESQSIRSIRAQYSALSACLALTKLVNDNAIILHPYKMNMMEVCYETRFVLVIIMGILCLTSIGVAIGNTTC